MTPEEKEVWEDRRKNARVILDNIAPTRLELKKLTQKYDSDFCQAWAKFSEADEMLAREDGRYHKVGKQTKRISDHTAEELLKKMSKEQILKLQEVLASQPVSGETIMKEILDESSEEDDLNSWLTPYDRIV